MSNFSTLTLPSSVVGNIANTGDPLSTEIAEFDLEDFGYPVDNDNDDLLSKPETGSSTVNISSSSASNALQQNESFILGVSDNDVEYALGRTLTTNTSQPQQQNIDEQRKKSVYANYLRKLPLDAKGRIKNLEDPNSNGKEVFISGAIAHDFFADKDYGGAPVEGPEQRDIKYKVCIDAIDKGWEKWYGADEAFYGEKIKSLFSNEVKDMKKRNEKNVLRTLISHSKLLSESKHTPQENIDETSKNFNSTVAATQTFFEHYEKIKAIIVKFDPIPTHINSHILKFRRALANLMVAFCVCHYQYQKTIKKAKEMLRDAGDNTEKRLEAANSSFDDVYLDISLHFADCVCIFYELVVKRNEMNNKKTMNAIILNAIEKSKIRHSLISSGFMNEISSFSNTLGTLTIFGLVAKNIGNANTLAPQIDASNLPNSLNARDLTVDEILERFEPVNDAKNNGFTETQQNNLKSIIKLMAELNEVPVTNLDNVLDEHLSPIDAVNVDPANSLAPFVTSNALVRASGAHASSSNSPSVPLGNQTRRQTNSGLSLPSNPTQYNKSLPPQLTREQQQHVAILSTQHQLAQQHQLVQQQQQQQLARQQPASTQSSTRQDEEPVDLDYEDVRFLPKEPDQTQSDNYRTSLESMRAIPVEISKIITVLLEGNSTEIVKGVIKTPNQSPFAEHKTNIKFLISSNYGTIDRKINIVGSLLLIGDDLWEGERNRPAVKLFFEEILSENEILKQSLENSTLYAEKLKKFGITSEDPIVKVDELNEKLKKIEKNLDTQLATWKAEITAIYTKYKNLGDGAQIQLDLTAWDKIKDDELKGLFMGKPKTEAEFKKKIEEYISNKTGSLMQTTQQSNDANKLVEHVLNTIGKLSDIKCLSVLDSITGFIEELPRNNKKVSDALTNLKTNLQNDLQKHRENQVSRKSPSSRNDASSSE